MTDESQIQLDEVKASMGVDAEANNPVAPAGGSPKGKNRKADVNKTVDPKADEIEDDVKTPQAKEKVTKAPPRKADKAKVSEAVSEIFSGNDLTEDFKDRASVIFETVVNDVIQTELLALDEHYANEVEMLEEKYEVAVDTAMEELSENVNKYLDYVANKWLEENQVAVDSGIKAEIAETFISGLKSLFAESNIEIPEESVDVVSEMATQVEEMEKKLNISERQNIELRKSLVEHQTELAFNEITEGMTETQKDKMRDLSENISYDNLSEYKSKVGIIRENYFGEEKPFLSETVDTGNQEIDSPETVIVEDQVMSRYAAALSKSIKK